MAQVDYKTLVEALCAEKGTYTLQLIQQAGHLRIMRLVACSLTYHDTCPAMLCDLLACTAQDGA